MSTPAKPIHYSVLCKTKEEYRSVFVTLFSLGYVHCLGETNLDNLSEMFGRPLGMLDYVSIDGQDKEFTRGASAKSGYEEIDFVRFLQLFGPLSQPAPTTPPKPMKQITEPIDIFTSTIEEHGKVYDRLISMGFNHFCGDYKNREAVMKDGDYYHTFMVRKQYVATHQFSRTGSKMGNAITAAQFLAEYGPAEVDVPKAPLNPANFVVITGGSPMLSRMVQEFALFTGMLWTNGENHVMNESSPYLYLIRGKAPFPFETKGIMHSNSSSPTPPADQWPIYSAATQMGEIVRLLSTPVVPPVPPPPTPPEIHGYKAIYSPGASTVDFGCAKIDLGIIRDAHDLMEKVRMGTRQVFGITLSSGKALSREQVTEILAYVAAVEEYAKKYPQKS